MELSSELLGRELRVLDWIRVMSTTVAVMSTLSEDEQQVVASLNTLLGDALAAWGEGPGGVERARRFLFAPGSFIHDNPQFPSLLNAVVAALKSIKTSLHEHPAKLEAWRSAVHPVVHPYIRDESGICQSYTQAGVDCAVRLSGPCLLAGVCSRHRNHCLVTGAYNGLGVATKIPCMHCGQNGGGVANHCIACDRKVHVACVSELFQEVCPSKAGQFDGSRDAVLCANCLHRRWPTAVMLWSLQKLEEPATQLLVLPEGAHEVVKESAARSEAFETFAMQYKAGRVMTGVMTIFPDEPMPGAGTPARGVRRPERGGTRRALMGAFDETVEDDGGDEDTTDAEDSMDLTPAAGAEERAEEPRVPYRAPHMRPGGGRGVGAGRDGPRGRGGVPPAPPPPRGGFPPPAAAGQAERAALEQAERAAELVFQRKIGSLIANFHSPTEGARSVARNGAAVLSGAYVKVAEGEIGAVSCRQLAWVETYDGNGTAAGKPWTAVVQSVMGSQCKNIADNRAGKGGPDHDYRRHMTVDAETGLWVEGPSTKGLIPPQATAYAWWNGRHDQLRAARDCDEGVMKQDHPEFYEQFQIITLVMARYRFLVVVTERLLITYGLQWPVVWRYVCYLASREWQTAGDAITVWDRQLISAAQYADYRPHMVALFTPNMAYISEAERYAAGKAVAEPGELAGAELMRLLRQIAQQQGAQQGKRAEAKPNKMAAAQERKLPDKCGLCGSKDHVYCKGAYNHPPEMPITNRCPQREHGKSGRQCILKHAYTGELETPCQFE